LACVSIAHVNLNMINNSAVGECPCDDPWYWDFGAKLCVLNCNNVSGANGTIPFNNDKCTCLQGLVWVNSPRPGCQVNCNTPHASPNPASPDTCNCAGDYYWNATMRLCYLRCGSIGRSTGQNDGADSC
jgi:hypothetical protein